MMFTFKPIGYVRSPYSETSQVPKGPGTQHQAKGVIEIEPEFEEGLLDIEGFSHLFIIWVFDRSEGYELTGTTDTPVLDIKPYMSRIPPEKLRLGWFGEAEARRRR
jgi:tRNA (Thr-GGU) A37 N-methylase